MHNQPIGLLIPEADNTIYTRFNRFGNGEIIDMTENFTVVTAGIDQLRRQCRTLVLATVDEGNTPLASQTPFVMNASNEFLVLVSGLAEHGRNLKTSAHAGIMLLQDEAGLVNPFARERLNYRCQVRAMLRDTKEWRDGEQFFRQRFGKFVDTLLQLPDFAMYCLKPLEGRYVAGFGAAYKLTGDEIQAIGPPTK